MARNILKPFAVAVNGIVYAFKTQRHMRFHLYAVVSVVLLGVLMDLRLREMMILLFMISFVVVAEMFNSAIEAVVDLAHPTYHPLAKFAKDMAAGAVLVTTVCALVVALLLFVGDGRWEEITLLLASTESQQGWAGKFFLGCFVLFLLIVIGKGLGKRGQVFKGGLVSGHAAFAFFIAGMVVFLSGYVVVSALAIVLAAMVAQSRWEARIHSLFELGIGATLGSLMALVLFGLGAR
ncbi:MAG: diacylglycerol kinase [Fimbriimonadales bacterium]|nr:diacylglycerol kinase [Fimbriimonadales bacterium]